ncbi:MAG TPA: translation initiation factor IF-2 [Spirochaetota bacterium]
MKALDLAKKNQTAMQDLLGICRDLGVRCESEDSEISGNDVFLVEKRIQTRNEERARHAADILRKKADDNKGKKIKLKRKVHLKGEGHEKEAEHEHEPEVEAVVEAPEPKAPPVAVPETPPVQKPAFAPHHPVRQPVPTTGDRRPREGSGYQGNRPQGQGTGGYQGNRPREGSGYQGNRPQGQGTGGYQGNRPREGSGYQGNRPQGQGTGGGYQGNRPQGQGTGGGYQGNRPQGSGYQGNRPQGQGTGGGYQGNRPQGSGGGYQGQRSGPGGPRTGGYGANRGPGGPGGRGPGGRPFSNQQRPFAQLGGDKKDAGPENLDQKKEKDKKKSKERDNAKTDKKLRRNEKESIESKIAREHEMRRRRLIEKPEFVAPSVIEITESVLVGELAKKLNIKASEVIARLMKLGVMATINQVLDSDTAAILAAEYGSEVKVVSLYEETVIRDEEEDNAAANVARPPIVTVMGHVDHGKTKLLDAIRSANVIDTEFGGITQHIGAYRVKVKDHYVTFLDTPGHEAFTTMRARGAKVTDIVVLVVAANDGVMPQTREAVAHAKDAGVPIIVAINKIDLPEANPMKIKQELMAYELVPEELGGTTLYAEISAKQKINIDGLLEKVLLQAEILELKANADLRAKGTVIESKLDPGRGAVASILVQNGTLHVGDPFVCGVFSGKVRAMFDDQGKPVESAGPSTPVEVLGLDGIPGAGDPFQAVSSEKYSKQISQKRLDLKRVESAKKVRKVTLESLNDMIKEGEVQEVRIIIKADVDGSVQALKDALEKLSTNEVRVKVILSTAGTINESDVMLASASNALIIGYHVRPSARIADLAERERVSIKTYNIIFEVTDSVRAAMEGMLAPEMKEEIMGTGEVRQVFKISKLGTIAGCIMLTGKIQRSNRVRLLRDGVVAFDGTLKSLKRYKDDATEVLATQECGIGLENYNDLKEGDTFEAYKIVEVAKKL